MLEKNNDESMKLEMKILTFSNVKPYKLLISCVGLLNGSRKVVKEKDAFGAMLSHKGSEQQRGRRVENSWLHLRVRFESFGGEGRGGEGRFLI